MKKEIIEKKSCKVQPVLPGVVFIFLFLALRVVYYVVQY